MQAAAEPTTTSRCPCCGHPASTTAACVHCRGQAVALDRRGAVAPGRGAAIADLGRGLRDVCRGGFALLHERAFVGRLRLPVAANLIAAAALIAAWVFGLWPLFAALFAGPWPRLDELRAAVAPHGTATWLCASWLMLGPALLDVLAGAAQEPLRAATELAMLGPPSATAPEHDVLRLRERIHVLLAALAIWPVALVLALVPWVGLPLVLLLGAAMAAVVWYEPPMALRDLHLPQRLHLLWRNRWRALGVGAGIQLATVVPFVNVLGLAPIATIVATSSYLHFDKRDDG